MIPQIDTLIDGYKFTYKGRNPAVQVDIQVIFEVKHIRRNKAGGIEVELSISSTGPSGFMPLTGVRFNLSSLSARSSLIRDFDKHANEHFNFKDVVTDVCNRTIALMQETDKAIEIHSAIEDLQEPTYLLRPLLPSGLPSIWFGDGGTGKSTLAKLIGLIVRSGYYDNPFRLTVEGQPSPVLYLDYETTFQEFKRSMNAICVGIKHPSSLHYMQGRSPVSECLDSLARQVNDLGIKLLIVDSLAPAAGGNVLEAEPAIRYYEALRLLKVTSLTVAHTSKSEFARKSIFGSVFFNNLARSVWEVKLNQDIASNVINVGLFHRKSNISGLFPALGFEITFNEDHSITPKLVNISDTELSKELPLKHQIVSLLRECPAMSINAIAESLGIEDKADTVKTTLYRYSGKKKNALFVNLRNNLWGLLNRPPGNSKPTWQRLNLQPEPVGTLPGVN